MARTIQDPAKLDAAAAYLAACADRDGIITGGYNWRILDQMAGEGEFSGLGLFDGLREAGRLHDLPSLPGTFGHSRFTVDEPFDDADSEIAEFDGLADMPAATIRQLARMEG